MLRITVPVALLLSQAAAFQIAAGPRAFLTTPGRRASHHGLEMADTDDNEDDYEKFDDFESDRPTFESLEGITPEALKAIYEQWPPWVSPTPVQLLAIPNLAAKAQKPSVWCQAPTGSGKSAAFCLPLLQNIMDSKFQRGDSGKIANLILCPTRELASQIGGVVTDLAKHMGGRREISIMTIHGGVPIKPQLERLADAAQGTASLDIVIATPGRLVDLLTYYSSGRNNMAADAALERKLLSALDRQEEEKEQNNKRKRRGTKETSLSIEQLNKLQEQIAKYEDYDVTEEEDDVADGYGSLHNMLRNVDCLVLDEADRLLGRAFQKEFDAILNLLPPKVPTWMFSATFPKLMEPRVDAVFQRVGAVEPLRLVCDAETENGDGEETDDDDEVSSSLQKRLDRTVATKSAQVQQYSGPASTIQQRVFRTELPVRTRALRYLLDQYQQWDRVLVFVSTRYASEHVSRKLRRNGISSTELHGKLDQAARLRRLDDFAKQKFRVLVATDVASRGLDIAGLPAVVNYDLPRSTADFVHRVGRTGRAGQPGTAVTFVSPAAESHWDLIESRHLSGKPIKREVVPGLEPDEERWAVEARASGTSVPGIAHSTRGLAHDRMHGGVKGRRKSKKDRLREQAARESANA